MKQAIVLLIITALFGCYGSEPEKTGLEGKPLPSFKLLLTDSTTYIDTKNIPKGKPIVLFYYGPYCPYSKAQMEEIIDDINVFNNVQIYVFMTGRFRDMKTFYTHYRLDKYKNIVAGLDFSGFFRQYFELIGVPFIAIYNKDMKLNKAFVGKINSKQIIKALDL
jgi:hypothetical protein